MLYLHKDTIKTIGRGISGGKNARKTLLGGSTLAIIMQNTLSSTSKSSNGSGEDKTLQFSASNLFSQLKETNKIMVKGAKLHESLSVRINPA